MVDASSAVLASIAIGGLPHGVARVRRFAAREAMSTSYLATVDLEIAGADLDPGAWVLAGAEIVVARAADGAIVRRLAGVVTRVREVASVDPGLVRLAVDVESPLAALAIVTDHRLFLDQGAERVARTLLAEAGVDPARVRVCFAGSHPAREVWTQLGESSFDFFSRVLEEDGVSYFFDHDEAGATIVLTDGVFALPSAGPIRVVRAEGLLGGGAVAAVTETERVRPAKVTLRSHDFRHPSVDLEVSAGSPEPLGRERYEAPGRYRDPGEGQRRADAILAAITADASTIRITGSLDALAPGRRFTIVDAPDAALDREYVVRSLELSWDEGDGAPVLASAAIAVRADAALAPVRKTPRPPAPGPALARVCGPRGSEIHCDEHGRVKVAFVWDRRASGDDRSSAWVRVGQAFLGGAIAIPRVGWEVIVDFEDGDPDAPVIVGRLYNGAFPPPYGLPASKAVSAIGSYSSPGGDGSNELRMGDAAGSEQVSLHAQKDLTLAVAASRTETIGGGESRVVAASQTVLVGGARAVSIGAASQVSVGGAQATVIGGARDESIGGDAKADVKGARTLAIGGSHTIMTPLSTSITTAGSLAEVVGGSVVEAAGAGASTAVAGSAAFTVGGAKVELAGAGKTETTIGAHATTIGGAAIAAAGGDLSVGSAGAKATTVGGVWAATAGADLELTAASSVSIVVGGAVALNAASITLAVGGSKVTIAGGAVSLSSPSIRLTATGPHVELGAMIEDN